MIEPEIINTIENTVAKLFGNGSFKYIRNCCDEQATLQGNLAT